MDQELRAKGGGVGGILLDLKPFVKNNYTLSTTVCLGSFCPRPSSSGLRLP